MTIARLLPRYHVDQARLSGIRRSRDDHPDPVLERLDPGTVEPGGEFLRQGGAVGGQRRIEADIVFVDIVDCRLGAGRELQDPLLPLLDLLAKAAFGHGQRRLALRLGFRLDEVGEALGLGQVDPAIFERAARELTRLRRTQAVDARQRSEDCIDDRAAAMALEFHDIFAGRARRPIEPEDERVVEHRPIRVREAFEAPRSWLREANRPAPRRRRVRLDR